MKCLHTTGAAKSNNAEAETQNSERLQKHCVAQACGSLGQTQTCNFWTAQGAEEGTGASCGDENL